jgi:catechol 2,3-dioxygenase-like lactoylglutathione lyase family enzyme
MADLVLDHVVIAVHDLEAATADYAALFGRAPSWRGSHPRYGTRNTLFRIDNMYVELLAPSGAKPKDGRWMAELTRFLDRSEGLYALAFGTSHLAETVRDLRDEGLDVRDPAAGNGIDEISGTMRLWRNATLPVKASHGTRMFFIEHQSPEDALPPAEVTVDGGGHVKRMDHAVILSVDMEKAKQLWSGTLGLRLALDRTFPERDTRILFYRAGDITIEISGGARQTEEGMGKPDRLWGLAWGVDDLDAMCARLTEQGIAVSEPRTGIKPGTRVASVRGPHTHGVATLLIEHSAASFTPEARLPQGAAVDNAPEQRAFTLTGLDHVVSSVRDIDEAARTWASVLGLDAGDVVQPPNANVKLARLSAGDAVLVLAEPLSQEHRIARSIAERGPGMYAIDVTVDDLDAAVRDLRAKGTLVSDPEYGLWPGTRVARIDRASAHGVSITLVQRLPEVL